MSEAIGIVAGWGNYPVSVAKALRADNHRVVVAAIEQHADPVLHQLSDTLRWFGVAKLGAQQRHFQKHGVRKVVLAGKLFKDKILFHGRGWIGLMPDGECMRTFLHSVIRGRDSQNDDALLSAVVASYRRRGIEIVPGTAYAPSLLAEPGILTRNKPTQANLADIRFGWPIAKQMGGLDIGQSVTVRDRTIMAVEAIEGTDACIERTGQVCPRGNFTLIKTAKPQQDRRFDQPTIGVQTVERMATAKGNCIAVEAGETIIVDRDEVIRRAELAGISIISLTNDELNR
jgi:DUF1009 family protein